MRGRWYVAAGVIAVLAVGACTHSSGSGGSNAGGALAPAGGAGMHGVAAAPSKAGTGDLSRSAGGGSAVQANAVPLVDGFKIRIARMTVAIKGASNVAAKANEAATIAEEAGGEVDQDDRTSGPHATASMLLRVPPDALTDTLTQLSRLGAEKSRSLSTTDVTQKVADVASRVQSARESIARLRILFHHAVKIGDIIQIESELNTREANLESLQAQQRALSAETSMATITLTLVTAVKPPPAPPKPKPKKHHHDNAFIAGLKKGWDGFSGAAAWVAEAVGTLLPFLVLLLALGIGWRWAWPRVRHGSTGRPSPAPSD